MMDDKRVWEFERSLWEASEERYHSRVDDECVMALSHAPHLVAGSDAADTVSGTPKWETVTFSDEVIKRPQEGLIVIGYKVEAVKDETRFHATCTSVYRRRAHEDWTVVQHSQVVI
ncbi:hypothetical protein [Falsirhodobacter halotolerans]|uniref:hypothetical protein n=1 Tax=Falsirhodobacter halotolerans TaxID=1146892 RepID=UPI001FD29343|nr:hypothetical protein [Falsirhodobacter halotolerans]MCJ8139537.1 hypothetical protein [Falsirhodobacter halotolerans]